MPHQLRQRDDVGAAIGLPGREGVPQRIGRALRDPGPASVLRATEIYAFFHVILPLSRQGIVSGFVMCWTRALGEFGATAMVAGSIPGVTETLPICIYTRATAGDLASAGAAAFVLAIISAVTLVGLRWVFGGPPPGRKA